MSEDIIQRSPEWFAARLGKVTASRVADILAKTKTGWGAGRANYASQLICERLTGHVAESYSNPAMQWGTLTEPEARGAYEWHANAEVREVGFVPHPTINMAGASPDGFVGDDGMVEIKCPNTATHIETLLDGAVPAKYITQMQFQMACAGRAYCDFVSFDPRVPEPMRLFVRTVVRDDEAIAEIEQQVRLFLAELAEKVERLRNKFNILEAA